MSRTLVALVLVCSAGGPARAYVIDEDGNGHRLHWQRSDIPVAYHLPTANVPDGGEDSVHAAARRWGAVSGGFAFAFAGHVDRTEWGYDRRNLLVWVRHDWPFDETMVATTVRVYDRHDGRLLDTDALFNAQRYPWGVGRSGEYDVENAAAHELGHVAGLGHSLEREATMFAETKPGETSKRVLERDDRDGLMNLYGGWPRVGSNEGSARSSESPLRPGGSGGGGCSISRSAVTGRVPSSWPREMLLLLALTAARRRRRRWVRRHSTSVAGDTRSRNRPCRKGAASGIPTPHGTRETNGRPGSSLMHRLGGLGCSRSRPTVATSSNR